MHVHFINVLKNGNKALLEMIRFNRSLRIKQTKAMGIGVIIVSFWNMYVNVLPFYEIKKNIG
jgi:hypothetical protein